MRKPDPSRHPPEPGARKRRYPYIHPEALHPEHIAITGEDLYEFFEHYDVDALEPLEDFEGEERDPSASPPGEPAED